jgi:CheY-like chemotaxis protein
LGALSGEWLWITVADTGIGIRKEDQEIIFDAFRQVDSSSVRKYEGTGLGLAITSQLVKLHNGYLWVESEPGKGSSFTIMLPFVQPTLEPTLDLQLVEDPDRPVVLVIDDDPSALQLVKDYLNDYDYQVVGLGNPAQAVELAHRLRPAAVITDIMMPNVSGWEILRELKADRETRDIPVIVLSIVEQKTIGHYLGAADYLIKPVTRDALLSSLTRTARYMPESPILIVDVNADDRAFLVRLLEYAGYQTVQAASSQAALDWLAQHSTALILLDLGMPEMTGFDFLEHLREQANWRDIPVIVITGVDVSLNQVAKHEIEQVFQKGAISGAVLVQGVQTALNKRLGRRGRNN